jgi:hypothetical protein
MKPIDVNLELPFKHKGNIKWIGKLQNARVTYKSNLDKSENNFLSDIITEYSS